MLVIKIEGKYFSGLDFQGLACTNSLDLAFCFYNLSQAHAMISCLLAGSYNFNESEVEVLFLDY